jgi:hypothetical protein
VTNANDIETADRLARRRARVLPVLAVLFIAQQGAFFSSNTDQAMRAVDHFKISAWLVLSVVLLAALSTNGFWFRSAKVRALMDDEVTRANRAEAFRLGFLIAMGVGILLYFISLYEPLSGREAIHALMTAGIGTALVRFGMLERRAFKDG